MAKYAFITDAETTHEAMGISEKRADFLIEKARETCLRTFVFDKEIDTYPKALEALINEAQPENVVEAMFVGSVFGRMFAKMSEMTEIMSNALADAQQTKE